MKEKTYSNNLRLIVNTKKDVNVVCFKVFVGVGAKDENPHQLGYAHFLEHMFFKSTSETNYNNILKKLDFLGASKNAYTDIDKTCYYFKCIPDVLEDMVKLYSEMLFNKQFKKDEIENEKNVVLEEYKMSDDEPIRKCIRQGYNSLFSGTPYEKDVLGTPASIKEITPQKLLAFKNKFYLPQNIVISVSGNVSFSKIDKLINKYFINKFGDSSTKELRKTKYFDLCLKNKYVISKKNNQQSFVYIIIDLKEQDFHSRVIWHMLFGILGGGMSSKFFEIIRGKLALVYSIEAGCSRFGNNFVGDILFSTSNDKVSQTLSAIKEILQNIANGDISVDELERVKNQYISALAFSYEKNSTIAENNGQDILIDGKIKKHDDLLFEYKSIKLKEVKEKAKQLILEKNFVVSAVGECTKNDLKKFN